MMSPPSGLNHHKVIFGKIRPRSEFRSIWHFVLLNPIAKERHARRFCPEVKARVIIYGLNPILPGDHKKNFVQLIIAKWQNL